MIERRTFLERLVAGLGLGALFPPIASVGRPGAAIVVGGHLTPEVGDYVAAPARWEGRDFRFDSRFNGTWGELLEFGIRHADRHEATHVLLRHTIVFPGAIEWHFRALTPREVVDAELNAYNSAMGEWIDGLTPDQTRRVLGEP